MTFLLSDLIRYALGWMMPPKFPFLKMLRVYMKKPGAEPNDLLAQDLVCPMETLPKALEYVHKESRIYPIWICPVTCLRDNKKCNSQQNSNHNGMHVDLGVYG